MTRTGRFHTILLVISMMSTSAGWAQTLIFVDAGAAGSGDGTSWENAFLHLQDALRESQGGYEIWVADGTYYPDRGSGRAPGDRFSSFALKNGVTVLGGFSGIETDSNDRNPEIYATILSGDIGVPGVQDDNTHQVVNGSSVDATAILDGVRIEGGNANGSGSYVYGGGMYIELGSPTLRTVTFQSNYAQNAGGGLFTTKSSPSLSDVTFEGNVAGPQSGFGYDALGGGAYSQNGTPVFENVEFVGNQAEYGGGIYLAESNPTMRGGVFRENAAERDGGGLRSSGATPHIEDIIFIGNAAGDDGGAIAYRNGGGVLTRATFLGNTAEGDGGAVYTDDSSPSIRNSVFSGNSAESGGGLYLNDGLPVLINLTLSQNTASRDFWGGFGGGIYCTRQGDNYPRISNTILSGNVADVDGAELYVSSGAPFVTHSLIKGDWPSGAVDVQSNLRLDPVFVDPIGADLVTGTLDDNLQVQSGSFAIDAGSNTALDFDGDGDTEDDIPRDREGNNRVWSSSKSTSLVDMGAYEFGAPVFVERPTLISAGAGYEEVELRWNPTLDRGVTGYMVFRSTAANPENHIATLSRITSYGDTNLDLGEEYHYRLRAIDSDGNMSSFSNELRATPFATVSFQVIHNDPDSPALDFYLNDQEEASSVPYGNATAFSDVILYNLSVKIDAVDHAQSGNGNPLGSHTATLQNDHSYVAFATDSGNQAVSVTLSDLPPGEPSTSVVWLVVGNGTADAASMDVRLLDETSFHVPYQTLADDLSFGSTSGYSELSPHLYNVGFGSGDGGDQYEVIRLNLSSSGGTIRTLVTQGLLTPGSGDTPFQVVLYDDAGVRTRPLVSTDVSDNVDLPQDFVLEQNYPNPFNPMTSITYGMPRPARVSLGVFDLLGREVLRVADETKPAGWHGLSLDARDLPSGIYLYRLTTESSTRTRMMIVQK